MALPVACLAVRGSTGINLSQGPPTYETVSAFTKDDSKNCKAMLFSPNGKYFAWANRSNVRIVLCETWKVVADIPRPKVSFLKFSPMDNYLLTWEPYTVTVHDSKPVPNLHIYTSNDGKIVKDFVQKKYDWEPEWSSDEKLCGMLINNEALFFEDANFSKPAHRFTSGKIDCISISPGEAPYHVLCYMPGKPGQPSLVRLFQYPKFDTTQSIANKTFFQADKVSVYWNNIGNSALVMTSTEVDKTGTSYYGKQTLHYISTKGETSLVSFSKEGTVHAVAWSPKNTEFCCIYGIMPSKATLFNQKCEPIFEFGVKHRNSIFFNPHGNLLMLAGFGNLQGNVEIWDMVNRKFIASTVASDTTLLQWSPDGEHFMTATTAPRLRISNGYKIWHYTGTLLYERPWNVQEELWEVQWQTFPDKTFPQKPISYKAVEGIAPSQPQASKQVYLPPCARGRQQTTKFQLYDDQEIFDPTKSTKNPPSKATLKLKKKKEAKKAKKELEGNCSQAQSIPVVNGQTNSTPKSPSATSNNAELTDDPEKNKKIKKLKMKLEQISKLKEQQQTGKQLEVNQLEKIKKEAELTKELQELIL